jgi:regulatory protein
MSKSGEKLSFKEALARARRYCAARERCSNQVRMKLRAWGLDTSNAGQVVEQLIKEGYIDDLRYTRIYAESKLRNNRWGKIKIKYMLITSNIQEEIIYKALQEIDDREYLETLQYILLKKYREIKGEDQYTREKKVAKFAILKGFEQDLVWDTMNTLKFD